MGLEIQLVLLNTLLSLAAGLFIGWRANRHATKLAEASGQFKRSSVHLRLFGTDLNGENGTTWYFVSDQKSARNAFIELPLVITNTGDAKTGEVVLTLTGSKYCLLSNLKREDFEAAPGILSGSAQFEVSQMGGMSQYSAILPSIPPKSAHSVFLPLIIPTESAVSGIVDVETKDHKKVQVPYSLDFKFPISFSVLLQDSPPVHCSINVASVKANDLLNGIALISNKFHLEWKKWSNTTTWIRIAVATLTWRRRAQNIRFVEMTTIEQGNSTNNNTAVYLTSKDKATFRSASIRLRVPPNE